ncbi:hypothetical protein Tco_0911415 [Tanacetum coccineum]|uniref:Uncharacterized protein n=1 Tax=Tanacetum coccineum TaxID=301880 RepID=A0ABQ5CVP6_9ASTR
MVSKEFAAHGPKMIEDLFRQHMQHTTLNLYPKTSSSSTTNSSADLQQQLYKNMKAKPQDQATDPEIWEILKAKTSGHDQTKINILQLFHDVINQTHVDYAALLWWDFMNNVFQKKESYSVSSIHQDDVPFVSVYTMGNVSVRGMLIQDAFLTVEIRETDDFKEYETVFMKLRRGKQTVGEYENLVQTKEGIIKKKKQPTPSIPPPGDDRERDAIAEATILSLALHKTALIAEAQENIAKVQEKLDEEEIDKMVEGNTYEESYTSVFTDSILNYEGADVDDTGKKENEEVGKEHNIVEKEVTNETNVETEKTDDVVKEKEVVNLSGSQEIRNEQKRTPIPSPIRSPRNVSFSDKTILEDLTDNISPITATTSKTSFTTKHKKRFFTLKTKISTRMLLWISWAGERQKLSLIISEQIYHSRALRGKDSRSSKTLRHFDKDREVSPIDMSDMVFKEFAAHGPKMIEELFRQYMQNTTLNL